MLILISLGVTVTNEENALDTYGNDTELKPRLSEVVPGKKPQHNSSVTEVRDSDNNTEDIKRAEVITQAESESTPPDDSNIEDIPGIVQSKKVIATTRNLNKSNTYSSKIVIPANHVMHISSKPGDASKGYGYGDPLRKTDTRTHKDTSSR